MINIVFGAGHVTGAKIWMGYNEDVNMLDLCNRKAAYVDKTYLDIKAHVLKVTNISGGYQAVENFIKSANADYASFEHSNADNSIDNEPNEPNRVVIYRTVKNPGDGPCSTIGQACATILATTLAQIQHRANGSGGDYYGVLGRAMRAGCKDAWLTEHGFHTNASCRAKLLDPNVRQQIAEKEVDAMAAYYGWTRIQEDDMLQKGDKGQPVYDLQTAFKRLGYDIGAFKNMLDPTVLDGRDGSFGDTMVGCVKLLQSRHNLLLTGIVDIATYGKLAIDLAAIPSGSGITQTMLDEEKAKTAQALASIKVLQDSNDGYKTQIDLQTEELADAALDIRNLLAFSNKH